jgi:hypothetical protein
VNGPPRDEETPEEDAIEQHQPAFPDDDDDLDDVPATMPDDASEADVLDQSRVVPIDDEYDDR